MLDQFHFIRPLWLLLIPAGLMVTAMLWLRMIRRSNWENVCDPHLIKPLLVGKQLATNRLPYAGLVLAWILAALALAGPAWQQLPQPVYSSLQGRVIVFDLSKSMDSTDLTPSRLARARYKLNDMILAGRGLQQGLVVFAGDAFTVAPLTDDTDTLINLVPSLVTDTLPVQGSRSDLGLLLAMNLFESAGFDSGEILLITDGISIETADIAEALRARGYRTSVLAVGTTEGAPIPSPDGGFLKNSDGGIVIPKLQPTQLRQVAQLGQGRYAALTVDNSDIRHLTRPISDAMDWEISSDPAMKNQFGGDRWVDSGPWLVLPLLVIAAAAFRRGWIISLLLFYLPLLPENAHAFGWDDLWQRPEQQAAALFKTGEFKRIGDNAPAQWRGAARYRMGDFDEAGEAFSAAAQMDARAHYNRGNTLARSRALEPAIEAYNHALQLDPGLEDAKFNRELVQNLLNQEEQAQQDSPQSTQQQESKQNSDSTDPTDSEQSAQQNGDSTNASQGQNSDHPEDFQQAEQESFEQESGEQKSDEQQQEIESIQQATDSNQENTDPLKPPRTRPQLNEQQLALEQWLKRIPDDPGGLLRRKFAWQYRQRAPQQQEQNW